MLLKWKDSSMLLKRQSRWGVVTYDKQKACLLTCDYRQHCHLAKDQWNPCHTSRNFSAFFLMRAEDQCPSLQFDISEEEQSKSLEFFSKELPLWGPSLLNCVDVIIPRGSLGPHQHRRVKVSNVGGSSHQVGKYFSRFLWGWSNLHSSWQNSTASGKRNRICQISWSLPSRFIKCSPKRGKNDKLQDDGDDDDFKKRKVGKIAFELLGGWVNKRRGTRIPFNRTEFYTKKRITLVLIQVVKSKSKYSSYRKAEIRNKKKRRFLRCLVFFNAAAPRKKKVRNMHLRFYYPR